jgi:hypothetical protein
MSHLGENESGLREMVVAGILGSIVSRSQDIAVEGKVTRE